MGRPLAPRDTARNDARSSVRERLLEAGLREFATHGYAGASLRRLTDAAGVGLGNVGHVFGGKRELLAAVFHRLFDPVAERRVALLEALERHKPNPTIVDVFDAAAEPVVELFVHEDGVVRGQFAMRSVIEHDVFWPLVKDDGGVAARFCDAAVRALEHLPSDEAAHRWTTASILFFQSLTPGFQNVAEPRPLEEAEVLRARRYAFSILDAPTAEACSLPPPPWSPRRSSP